MLREIYIENLAVIKQACITLSDGLNVFTGETGAGKSILIGGINAVLGMRVTKDIVRTGCEKATISALFSDIDNAVIEKLAEYGFSVDSTDLLITREIRADGGSVARINSRTAPVSLLREIGNLLVNIHGQHDSQILLTPEMHLSVLENFGGDFTLLEDYRASFRQLQSIAKELKALKIAEADKEQRLLYLDDKIEELEKLNLVYGEYEQLSEEYGAAKSAEEISEALNICTEVLSGDDSSAVNALFSAESALDDIQDVFPACAPLYERLNQARFEIQDISETLCSLQGNTAIDEERAGYVVKRFEELEHIKKRYAMEIDEILESLDSAKSERETLSLSSDEIERLSKKRSELLEITTVKAKKLSLYRKKLADDFCQKVGAELEFLNMPGVKIVPHFESGKLTMNGMDSFELLICSNAGEVPKPIAKIASGGELSRIMLALKNVIADKDSVPTLIFDEIDAGVSGRAAQKIGIKLREISKIRQVLCVTHLSQIAVMAKEHILIEKKVAGGRTETSVKPLDFNGKVAEIARIMGGENPSELMLENARAELDKYRELI